MIYVYVLMLTREFTNKPECMFPESTIGFGLKARCGRRMIRYMVKGYVKICMYYPKNFF